MTANEIRNLTFEEFITGYDFDNFTAEVSWLNHAMNCIENKEDLSCFDTETIKIAKRQIRFEKTLN